MPWPRFELGIYGLCALRRANLITHRLTHLKYKDEAASNVNFSLLSFLAVKNLVR
jgi:hypothetical protein